MFGYVISVGGMGGSGLLVECVRGRGLTVSQGSPYQLIWDNYGILSMLLFDLFRFQGAN
jgi:hypothetical protein